MKIIDAIDETKSYCVYSHHIDECLFYVGSGALPRAFESGHSRRNESWNLFVSQAEGYPRVTVRIEHRCETKAEARRVEYDLIHSFRPFANQLTPEREWQVVYIDDQKVATDACFGKLVVMLPERITFGSIRAASKITGISESAISNSLSGRYPTVKGKTFRRIARPLHGNEEFLKALRALE